MEMTEKIIAKIKYMRDVCKTVDVHINDSDDINTIRQKDMTYGKLIAYEYVCELLGIE